MDYLDNPGRRREMQPSANSYGFGVAATPPRRVLTAEPARDLDAGRIERSEACRIER